MYTPQKRTVTKTVTEFRIPLGEGTVHARDLSDTMHVVGSFVQDLRKTDSITDDAYQVDADSESIVFVVEHPDEEVKWLGGVQPPSAMSRMESTLKFLFDNGPCEKSKFHAMSNVPQPSLDILIRLNLVKVNAANATETYTITPAGQMLLTGDPAWVDGEEDVHPSWGIKAADWTIPEVESDEGLKITVDDVYRILGFLRDIPSPGRGIGRVNRQVFAVVEEDVNKWRDAHNLYLRMEAGGLIEFDGNLLTLTPHGKSVLEMRADTFPDLPLTSR